MSIFRELKTLHNEIENQYSIAEFEAGQSQSDEQSRILHKRKLNDSAYYLFMFTRLEDFIREQSSLLITEKQRLSNWEQRRAWTILPKDKNADNISFLNRVALLVEEGRDSHFYKKIKTYYDLRNKFAHGGNSDLSINISEVVTDFESFVTLLKHTKQ